MRRTGLIFLSTVIAVSAIALNPSVGAENIIDLTKPGNFLLGICKTATQLDCLEPNITVTHGDGTVSEAQLHQAGFAQPFLDNPNLNLGGFHYFRFSSGSRDGYSREFNIRVTFSTPPTKPMGNLEVRIVSPGKKLKSDECDQALSKLCTRYNLDPEDNFKIIVRSQKIPVHWIGAHGQNADALHEDYLTGDKWILTGAQTLIGWNPGLWWSIAAVDPLNAGTFFKNLAECSAFGVVFKTSNEVTGGLPSWNSKTNSLDFGVSGPHLDANGDLFNGFFKARIPRKWLDCTYPENTLSTASQVVVNITYDDGTIQVATTQTRVTGDMILIDVPVLHFSSPTIQIANAALVAKATPPAKAKVLTCVKGKSKKKVTATKCPSGWKLVA